MEALKKGDLVVTSRSRYGRVISFDPENEDRVLVRMGIKDHWIYRNQLTKTTDCIRLKVIYEFNYINNMIETSEEVILKKQTIIYDYGDPSINLLSIVTTAIEKKINSKVTIKQILIS